MNATTDGSAERSATDNRRRQPDSRIDDHGSVVVLTLMSAAAKNWHEAHLPDDAMAWGLGVAIERRYIQDILSGIADDGLTIAV